VKILSQRGSLDWSSAECWKHGSRWTGIKGWRRRYGNDRGDGYNGIGTWLDRRRLLFLCVSMSIFFDMSSIISDTITDQEPNMYATPPGKYVVIPALPVGILIIHKGDACLDAPHVPDNSGNRYCEIANAMLKSHNTNQHRRMKVVQMMFPRRETRSGSCACRTCQLSDPLRCVACGRSHSCSTSSRLAGFISLLAGMEFMIETKLAKHSPPW